MPTTRMGEVITLAPARRAMAAMVAALNAMPVPVPVPGEIEVREPIEIPDRDGR